MRSTDYGSLVKFLNEKGNFEFLAENNLFTAPLRYGEMKVDWTLDKLISKLSEPDAHGNHDEATPKALKNYSYKIAEGTKKNKP